MSKGKKRRRVKNREEEREGKNKYSIQRKKKMITDKKERVENRQSQK